MEWFYLEGGISIGPNSFDAMERHIKSGRIGGETLIWAQPFGASWKPLRTVEEFASLLVPSDAALPPAPTSPLGPTPPPPPPAPVFVSDAAPPEPPQWTRRDESAAATARPSARDALAPAGLWSRYFARQIDLTIWSVAAIAGISIGLMMNSPPDYYRFAAIPETALGVFGVFLGIIINGLIVGIFGTSIGKAIFGIRVFQVGSDAKLPFGTAFLRELKVWVFGLGLGVPIAAFILFIVQYRKVRARGTTGYDAGRYLVRQNDVGEGRIGLGIVFAILLIGGVGLLGVWSGAPARTTLVAWTNPESGIETTISSIWQVDRQAAEDGSVASFFSNSTSGESILVGLETYAGGSVSQYGEALRRTMAANATVSGWTPISADAVMATGKLGANGIPMDLYVYKIGDRYWRVVSFDMTAAKAGHFIDQPALEAIRKTLN